jgi:hypothetical protein
MAKIKWNPKDVANNEVSSPVVWACHILMREDGSFETEFKGETGFQMLRAAFDALRAIDRLRSEPPCNFGAERRNESS